MKFLSQAAFRPVSTVFAVKVAFCLVAANVSFAAAHVLLAKSDAVSQAALRPALASEQVVVAESKGCREVEVEIDQGYGVSDHVTRTICRTAL